MADATGRLAGRTAVVTGAASGIGAGIAVAFAREGADVAVVDLVSEPDAAPVLGAIRERGVTILMIEHVMQAVMSLAEHIYVLVEGHVIAQGPATAIVADPRVIEAYLGKKWVNRAQA